MGLPYFISYRSAEPLAGKLMSDAAIVAGLAGWAAVTAAALQSGSPRLLQALAASAGAYFAGGGRLWGSDPLLVDALKQAFQRARPSEHHHTFAFPRYALTVWSAGPARVTGCMLLAWA